MLYKTWSIYWYTKGCEYKCGVLLTYLHVTSVSMLCVKNHKHLLPRRETLLAHLSSGQRCFSRLPDHEAEKQCSIFLFQDQILHLRGDRMIQVTDRSHTWTKAHKTTATFKYANEIVLLYYPQICTRFSEIANLKVLSYRGIIYWCSMKQSNQMQRNQMKDITISH